MSMARTLQTHFSIQSTFPLMCLLSINGYNEGWHNHDNWCVLYMLISRNLSTSDSYNDRYIHFDFVPVLPSMHAAFTKFMCTSKLEYL